jgi:hypothetical protein
MAAERRRTSDFDLGRLEGKLDLLLDHHTNLQADLKTVVEKFDERIESLEVTRTKQRAYWRALTVAGSIVVFILGKLLLFTSRVAVSIPTIPVK